MRKLLGIALLTFLLVIGWSVLLFNNRPSVAADYGSRLFQSHQYDRPIASGAIAQTPAQEVKAQEVTYGTLNKKPITGYLARPTNATKPLPGLIVIHEWWGLNDNIKTMTRRLAGEGYTALAVDLFNGQVADNPQQAKKQVQTAANQTQQLKENIQQAYQYLEKNQEATKIGSIGWCFGGSWSLNTALLLPKQLDAAVIYYGGDLKTDPKQLRPLEMPILGIFGALDDNPSVKTVRAFESALKSLDKPAEIYVYEGADHAFANPSGTRYNAKAAEDAWEKTSAFLNKHLKG
ncbi:MAG: dienelactone hydrolase family protein [Scytonema sp. PMC 1069.18]|nr:dienelactone hydrolase family protein [Scytonema sp. PMC 1069.18]MEC4882358.1 dienelactone hydrolase family protein [Scytonema sp. PMC 1070.18]